MDSRPNEDSDVDAIGELTVSETLLSELLKDILRAVQQERVRNGITASQAARDLQGICEKDSTLFPAATDTWLGEVIAAANERNAIVHAVAMDRCIHCGHASRFEHRGESVDRSRSNTARLTVQINALIADGLVIARDISGRVNARAYSDAMRRAAETGLAQSPPQIKIGSIWHECADCSADSRSRVTIGVPAAVLALPPGRGREFFLALGGSPDEWPEDLSTP